MLFYRFAPYLQWFLPFTDNNHCELSEPLSCCGKSKTIVKYPWGFHEQDPKSINRDPKSTWILREKTVKKRGIRRLKSRVQTIDECALHVYIHVLVDKLNIWRTSVGLRDLGRFCMIFLYIIGLFFWPKLHIKSWTMITKCTFLYDKCPSIHDIANKYHVFEKLLGSFRNDPQTWGLSAKDPKNWGGWNTSFFF